MKDISEISVLRNNPNFERQAVKMKSQEHFKAVNDKVKQMHKLGKGYKTISKYGCLRGLFWLNYQTSSNCPDSA